MRSDISDKVVHFTKGEKADDAYKRLKNILHEGRVLGSAGMVRGNYRCVSFTEAPPSHCSVLV